MLCLGRDAPFGDPKRLIRKIMFRPPLQGASPRIYAPGVDLTDGARIVVAYEDMLVLFSVPRDVFEFSRKEQHFKGTPAACEGSPEQWLRWWPENDILLPSIDQANPTNSVWPLLIGGTIIGQLEGLVDIAVNETAGLAIWAFGLDGKAAVWQIDGGRPGYSPKLRSIAKDGRVVDVRCMDSDGDVVMADVDLLEWSVIIPNTLLSV
jgi:hypothetical protein